MAIAGLGAIGCGPEPVVTHYRVPREKGTAPFEFVRPQGWRVALPGEMRVMAFDVREGDQRAEITVSTLGAAGSALLPNVNRWRGQMGLPPLNDAELAAEVKQVPVGPLQGGFVAMQGAGDKQGQATLGVVVINGASGWFFKLSGDAGLAERERERFLQFVASIKFHPAEGDVHGHR
ncbi:MAG: hypothetical protein JSS27_07765 [Planctomycetes bacterium]|nr:hypothetical protein [Planctomycetota bacterium]